MGLVWARDSALYRDSSSSGFVWTPSRLLPSCCPSEAVERARQDRAWSGLTVADQGTRLGPGRSSSARASAKEAGMAHTRTLIRGPQARGRAMGHEVRLRPALGCGWPPWGRPPSRRSSSPAAPCTSASPTGCWRFWLFRCSLRWSLPRRQRIDALLGFSIAALVLFAVESALGGVVALAGRPEWAVVLSPGVRRPWPWRRHCSAPRRRSAGEHVPAGAWRDYLALTKPRIMVLLLITAAAGMFVGAGGLPNLPELAIVLAGGCARLWRGERAESLPRPRHRRPDGRSNVGKADRRGSPDPSAGGRVRARALGLLLRPAGEPGECPDGDPGPRGGPLLRARLHALAQALDRPEHRHRGRRRRGAAAGRLGRRDRQPDPAGDLPLPDHLLLDAAALLVPRPADQARVRRRARSRCCPSCAGIARPRAR